MTFEQALTSLRRKLFPGWKINTWDITANLTKGSSTAEVWVSVRGNDDQERPVFNRESVSILYWRKRRADGRWICYQHSAIRGSGDFHF